MTGRYHHGNSCKSQLAMRKLSGLPLAARQQGKGSEVNHLKISSEKGFVESRHTAHCKGKQSLRCIGASTVHISLTVKE